jgi:hypothetical protein
MPDRNHRKSRSGHGGDWKQAAQDATLAREQASHAADRSVARTLTEVKGKKPTTITLQDGSVVDAEQAACTWNLLKDFPREEPAAFQELLAMAQGRTHHADARHFKALKVRFFVSEDHTIESVTRAVLLNSFANLDGSPMIAALRLKSAIDKTVLEKVQAQLHQDCSEAYARSSSPGGWFDQLMKKIERERGKGPSGRE